MSKSDCFATTAAIGMWNYSVPWVGGKKADPCWRAISPSDLVHAWGRADWFGRTQGGRPGAQQALLFWLQYCTTRPILGCSIHRRREFSLPLPSSYIVLRNEYATHAGVLVERHQAGEKREGRGGGQGMLTRAAKTRTGRSWGHVGHDHDAASYTPPWPGVNTETLQCSKETPTYLDVPVSVHTPSDVECAELARRVFLPEKRDDLYKTQGRHKEGTRQQGQRETGTHQKHGTLSARKQTLEETRKKNRQQGGRHKEGTRQQAQGDGHAPKVGDTDSTKTNPRKRHETKKQTIGGKPNGRGMPADSSNERCVRQHDKNIVREVSPGHAFDGYQLVF